VNEPGPADIQSDLSYNYRTNVETCPKWQSWMREKQPRPLAIWGKYDLSFDLGEPERNRRDIPDAEVHVLDAGHFALDTAPDEIAAFGARICRLLMFGHVPMRKVHAVHCAKPNLKLRRVLER
jgi:pimeloyl-ACP methyl ester carboxylesterase